MRLALRGEFKFEKKMYITFELFADINVSLDCTLL